MLGYFVEHMCLAAIQRGALKFLDEQLSHPWIGRTLMASHTCGTSDLIADTDTRQLCVPSAFKCLNIDSVKYAGISIPLSQWQLPKILKRVSMRVNGRKVKKVFLTTTLTTMMPNLRLFGFTGGSQVPGMCGSYQEDCEQGCGAWVSEYQCKSCGFEAS